MPTVTVEKTNGGHAREKMKGVELIFIAIGAISGAFLRYKITSSSPWMLLGTLPINVLIVNITGSFFLGLFSMLTTILNLDSKYSLLVAVGFCGSYTTMSSFALETTQMIDERLFVRLTINILANVGLSIAAVIAGRQLISLIFRAGGASLP